MHQLLEDARRVFREEQPQERRRERLLLQNLESDVASAILWFDANYMKLNQPKCHFIAPSHSPEELWIKVGQHVIWESKQERLLGLDVDKQLKFEKHVQIICKKASAKVTALGRLIRIVSMEKKKILMNSFIESQFSILINIE